MKRVLSVILICALLMAGLTTFVSAAAVSISITTDKTTFEVGEEVTATVKLNGYEADSWSAITIAVEYDSDVLAYVSAESGLDASAGLVAEDKDGKVLLCWIAEKLPAHAVDGFLAKVHFEAIAETTNPVKIQSSFVADGIAAQGSTTPVDNTNEEIYVLDKAESTPIEIQPEEPQIPSANSATLGGNNTHEISAEGLTQAVDVRGDYNDSSTKIQTYKIDLSWNDLTLIYNDNAVDTWDPYSHTWVPAVAGTWTDEGKGTVTVDVVNHSSQPVTVELAYADAAGGATTSATAAEEITVNAPAVNAPAGVSGSIASEVTATGVITEDGVLGAFTVTIK